MDYIQNETCCPEPRETMQSKIAIIRNMTLECVGRANKMTEFFYGATPINKEAEKVNIECMDACISDTLDALNRLSAMQAKLMDRLGC